MDFPSTSAGTEVAVVDRGGCLYTTKVKLAQDADYVAVIVVNHEGDELFIMGGVDTSITIPSVFVGLTDGTAIKGLNSATLSGTHRDGDLDGDIVWHEYGHGLTWRIVDNMTGFMGGAVGEGASDALSIVMTNNPVVGEYANGNAGGIRSNSYDNYFEATGRTYESIEDNTSDIHYNGEIYAAIIWDMWKRYRDEACNLPDDPCLALIRGQMMDDMVGGMTLTTLEGLPQTTFPAMRNGILHAIGGDADPFAVPAASSKNRWCHAWQAFAKYGVGVSQSTTIKGPIRWTWTEAFDIPSVCEGPIDNPPSVSITSPTSGMVSGTVTITADARIEQPDVWKFGTPLISHPLLSK